MKIQDLVLQATQFLKPTSPSARLDAELIISDVLKCQRTDLYIHAKKEIPQDLLGECLQKIERRISGEPVAYILKKKEFLNHTFFIQPGVLIPRPETELLVEYVLHWIENEPGLNNPWVLDLGCGSGCISISLLKEVYKMNVVAVDLCEKAVETSQVNAKMLDVENRIFIFNKDADLLVQNDFSILKSNGYPDQFDIIISNPPYIAYGDKNVQPSVDKYEPHKALYCDKLGLEKIEKWTAQAVQFLKPKGLWIFEIGSTQGQSAKKIVETTGAFEKIEIAKDFSGHDRFIIAFKKKEQTYNS